MTVCLWCGRRRVETVCGDQSCRCLTGKPSACDFIAHVQGLVWNTDRGPMVRAKCGKLIPEKNVKEPVQ